MTPITPLAFVESSQARAALASANARAVECVLGDFTSIARGKRVHADDFVALGGCKLPSVVLGLTLTGG